jgi:nucleoside-diphosphate-sugar epimerase
MKVLITGTNGYIGNLLQASLSSNYQVTKLSRKEADLTNFEQVKIFFSNKTFDIVIHCASKGGNRLIKDNWDVMDNNLLMYYNLLNFHTQFNKFIHFTSGAENRLDPYGLSKKIISKSIEDKKNFFNIKIFATFDENELSTRFIKSNLLRYKNKVPLLIHQDKKMDFFYSKDLIRLVEHYINNDNLPKTIDCTYQKTYTLREIATIINNIDNHKSEIIIDSPITGSPYCGIYTPILPYTGLEKGIKEVYKAI